MPESALRISTLDLQFDDLKAAGCKMIFADKISGVRAERPGLDKCLNTLIIGDTLIVRRLNRFRTSYTACAKEILTNCVLGNVQCGNRGKTRQFCILLVDELEVNCSSRCLAFNQVKDMQKEFNKFHTESGIDVC